MNPDNPIREGIETKQIRVKDKEFQKYVKSRGEVQLEDLQHALNLIQTGKATFDPWTKEYRQAHPQKFSKASRKKDGPLHIFYAVVNGHHFGPYKRYDPAFDSASRRTGTRSCINCHTTDATKTCVPTTKPT